jgi:uncharacterized membrane protein
MTNILLVLILLVLLFGSGAILAFFGWGLGAILAITIVALIVLGLLGLGKITIKQIEVLFTEVLSERSAGVIVVSIVIILFMYLFVRLVILGQRWY